MTCHTWLVALVVALASCSYRDNLAQPAAQGSAAGINPTSLVLRLFSSTATYRQPDEFRLEVTFVNTTRNPIVILPSGLRRNYRVLGRGSAHLLPYPGPRLAPWLNAFVLAGGESRTIELIGMRDGDAVWKLDSGPYELSVEFAVSPELAQAAASHLQIQGVGLWHGQVKANPISVMFQP